MSDARLWLLVIVLASAAYVVGHHQGHNSATLTCQARESLAAEQAAQQRAVLIQKVRALERALDSQLLTLTDIHRKEKQHAATEMARLRIDLRTGAERLSVAVAACDRRAADPDSAAAHRQARAYLLPATAETLLNIGADADDTVRDLNLCIDHYHAIASALNAQAAPTN